MHVAKLCGHVVYLFEDLPLLSALVLSVINLSCNDDGEKRTLSTHSSRAGLSLCSLEHTCVTSLALSSLRLMCAMRVGICASSFKSAPE